MGLETSWSKSSELFYKRLDIRSVFSVFYTTIGFCIFWGIATDKDHFTVDVRSFAKAKGLQSWFKKIQQREKRPFYLLTKIYNQSCKFVAEMSSKL